MYRNTHAYVCTFTHTHTRAVKVMHWLHLQAVDLGRQSASEPIQCSLVIEDAVSLFLSLSYTLNIRVSFSPSPFFCILGVSQRKYIPQENVKWNDLACNRDSDRIKWSYSLSFSLINMHLNTSNTDNIIYLVA